MNKGEEVFRSLCDLPDDMITDVYLNAKTEKKKRGLGAAAAAAVILLVMKNVIDE